MTTHSTERLRTDSGSPAEPWDRVAAGWSDSAVHVGRWLRQATDAMIGMAGIHVGHHVLDVAAGSGDQTLDVAARVGRDGFVLATDISAPMLAAAQRNAQAAGCRNVETRVCNGERLDVADCRFDAAVCRLGLMFFQDPVQGLREMHRALKPGGGVCTVVFSGPERNPCITTMLSTVLQHAGMPPRDLNQAGGLLSLGKPGLADSLFREAGFEHIATTAMPAPFVLPSVRHYLDFIRAAAGPIHQLLQGMNDDAREALWNDIERRLARFETPSGWEGPNELLLTAARKPA
jgi:ubiquinone/menaquinone biosynthesis C-methylase UbiE